MSVAHGYWGKDASEDLGILVFSAGMFIGILGAVMSEDKGKIVWKAMVVSTPVIVAFLMLSSVLILVLRPAASFN